MQTYTQIINQDAVELKVHFCLPDNNKPDKIVVLHHGMAEHSSRYTYVAQKFTEKNKAFVHYDMRGHGETARSDEELGFLADKDGFNTVTRDLLTVINTVKEKFPDLPVFLLGHSFGSFVSQNFIEQFGSEINGCILSGTAGPRLGLGLSLYLAAGLICLFQGKKARSKFLTWCSFGSYNEHFPDEDPAKLNWISSDKAAIDSYMNDKFCGFMVTNAFYRDLGYALSTIHLRRRMKKIPKNLPVLIYCGTDDPVGSYTKTVKNLYKCYKKYGIQDVTEKYYPGGRHEMFNEVNKDEVIADVLAWLERS